MDLELSITSTEGATTEAVVSVPTGRPESTPDSRDAAAPHVPVEIPEESGGVTSTLTVPESGLIADINVRIGSLTHNWVGDLVIELTSPDGTTINLVSQPGGADNSGNNLIGTVLDDEASTAIGAGGTVAPYTGSFRPQFDELARFDGEGQDGTWTLTLDDVFEDPDPGTLNSWGHDIRNPFCGPPPGAVGNLTAAPGPESVVLEWDDTAAATSYEVFRRDPTTMTYPALTSPTATTGSSSHTDVGRTPGVQDCYKVRAVGDGGQRTAVRRTVRHCGRGAPRCDRGAGGVGRGQAGEPGLGRRSARRRLLRLQAWRGRHLSRAPDGHGLRQRVHGCRQEPGSTGLLQGPGTERLRHGTAVQRRLCDRHGRTGAPRPPDSGPQRRAEDDQGERQGPLHPLLPGDG